MKVVGVKQLKARLSEYLREVRRGEVYLVTDRDQVVAELRPAGPGAAPPADGTAAALHALEATGEVQPSRLPAAEWEWRPAGVGLPDGTAERLLGSLREER